MGYQVNSPDAFYPYYHIDDQVKINRLLNSVTPDDAYADGVLLSYNIPREHIWTFTAQSSCHTKNNRDGCPCLHDYKRYEGKVPLFVGQDFFCETGNYNENIEAKTYTSNKLWDGTGCGTFPGGCEGSRDTWFHWKFSFAIKSDLEMRLCLTQGRWSSPSLQVLRLNLQRCHLIGHSRTSPRSVVELITHAYIYIYISITIRCCHCCISILLVFMTCSL